nr:hypothetical protein [Streptomyces polyasparticus]
MVPVAVGWAWGAFAVPGDPSRGESDVRTPQALAHDRIGRLLKH